jgi:hypothetical protein
MHESMSVLFFRAEQLRKEILKFIQKSVHGFIDLWSLNKRRLWKIVIVLLPRFEITQTAQFKMTARQFLIDLTLKWVFWGSSEKIVRDIYCGRITRNSHFRGRKKMAFSQNTLHQESNLEMNCWQKLVQLSWYTVTSAFSQAGEQLGRWITDFDWHFCLSERQLWFS